MCKRSKQCEESLPAQQEAEAMGEQSQNSPGPVGYLAASCPLLPPHLCLTTRFPLLFSSSFHQALFWEGRKDLTRYPLILSLLIAPLKWPLWGTVGCWKYLSRVVLASPDSAHSKLTPHPNLSAFTQPFKFSMPQPCRLHKYHQWLLLMLGASEPPHSSAVTPAQCRPLSLPRPGPG